MKINSTVNGELEQSKFLYQLNDRIVVTAQRLVGAVQDSGLRMYPKMGTYGCNGFGRVNESRPPMQHYL